MWILGLKGLRRFGHQMIITIKYRKIPKISPSMYKPPQTRNAKKPPLNRPSLYLEMALKYKVKQSKNSKFPSNYKASPINFETQISLHR